MRSALLAGAAAALTACTPPGGGEPVFTATPQESGVESSLRGLSVVDAQTAWIGAPGGRVLRTIDGGSTWQLSGIAEASELDLRSAHGFDATRALFFTAGQPARLYLTEDGGATFSMVWEDETGQAFFDTLAFWNDLEGLAFSDPVDGRFLVLLTFDGGRTWQEARGLPDPLPGEAGFAASNTSMATSPDGCAYIGTGGGETARLLRGCGFGAAWDAVDTPLAAGTPGSGIFSVAWTGDRLVVSGGNYEAPDSAEGVLAWSRNHGESWSEPLQPPRGYRSAVAALPGHPRILLATGPNGTDISRNAGEIWTPLDAIDGHHALAFAPDGSAGWAVGPEGRITRIEVSFAE
jgi:photosystem II stability/assembly factor-like uncharacterized protein